MADDKVPPFNEVFKNWKPSAAAKKAQSPEELERLEALVKDLSENEPEGVELVNVERFSGEQMVKVGQKRPPRLRKPKK